jgi:hypothetical protein
MIYITNAVESLHRSCRKIIQTRSSCSTDEGPPKLLFPAIRTPAFTVAGSMNGPPEWASLPSGSATL